MCLLAPQSLPYCPAQVENGQEHRHKHQGDHSADENYKERLDRELGAIHNSEMWKAGEASRSLRPKGKIKEIAKGTKGVGGRAGN